MTGLQRIVENLGVIVGRSVALFDDSLRLLVHNSHSDTDSVRTATIIGRRPPKEALEVAKTLPIATASDPVRLPPVDGIGAASRVCVPVRADDRLLGYLFLLDPDDNLTDEDLGRAAAAADACAALLLNELLVRESERRYEQELLASLIGSTGSEARQAAMEMVERGLSLASEPLAAIVVVPKGDQIDVDFTQLEAILAAARHHHGHRQSIDLVLPGHGILLAAVSSENPVAELTELANFVYYEAHRTLSSEAVRVGIGTCVTDLEQARLTYEQACRAAFVGTVVPDHGPVVVWSDLGVYQLLTHFPFHHLDERSLPDSLMRLFQHAGDFDAIRTLECYLDNACSVQRTARDLDIHRATLYYRLQRIGEIGHCNINSGADLLELHLGLKLARLCNLPSPKDAQPAVAERDTSVPAK